MNPRRAALYARVSTAEQTTENQLLDLRNYAASRGWVIAQEYQDIGVSGSKKSRPGLDKLMQDARKRKFDVVLVFRFDRFSRSVTHLLNSLEEFRQVGVDFVSFSENIDTTSALGQMVFTVVSAVAQLERSIIVERVNAGIRRARSQGKHLGRPRSNINTAEVLRLKAEGLSHRCIGKQLGIPKSTVADVLKHSSMKSGTCPEIRTEMIPVSA